MRKLLPIGIVCLLVSCAKTNHNEMPAPEATNQEAKKETCTFGISNFNLSKRAPLGEDATKKPRNPGGGGGGTTSGGGTTDGGGTTTTPPPTTTTPTTGAGVILLDFDGHTVSGTWWNGGSTFYCAPANITTSDMANIWERVSNDYSPFNVTVTLDENVYNAAPINKRVRVLITESHDWYGQSAGGAAYIGTFTAGTNTPCFVFSSLLYYNAKYIGEAASHEAGHTFGLYHQSNYSNCTKISDYHSGIGYGEETSWAPIMGSGYSQNLTLWHRGSSTSCTTTQDDLSVISSILGFKADDYVNSFAGSALLISSLSGQLNSSYDVDFFTVNLSYTRSITLTPSNVGGNNSGANADMVMNVYNSYGNLVTTVNDPYVLNASVTLPAGSYYVSAGSAANANTGVYGMLGKYSITLN